VLQAAHEQAAADGLLATDDVTVCEHAGHQVTLVTGARAALKITEPDDLVLAEALLAQETAPVADQLYEFGQPFTAGQSPAEDSAYEGERLQP